MIGLLCFHSKVSGCQLPCCSELTDGGCWECCFGLEFSGTVHRLVLLSFSSKFFWKSGWEEEKLSEEIRATCLCQHENKDSP